MPIEVLWTIVVFAIGYSVCAVHNDVKYFPQGTIIWSLVFVMLIIYWVTN